MPEREGYVHDPDRFREEGDGPDEGERPARARTTRAYVRDVDGVPGPDESEFDWRGWVLVGMIFVAFIVAPAIVLYLPYSEPLISSLGLSFRDAYLTVPLIPALALGALAVWAAVSGLRR
ncbi:hypothetical protein [Halomarina ordinaria]|uniref:Cox cluster protein n=1 Tax=Halomarina ordinaria TaxID=3033939 RepID=A0ABD5U3D9_9EURY|nr:hypothetical protein [Halomarina sp. PSRA2]